jgi:proline iminopeptidase
MNQQTRGYGRFPAMAGRILAAVVILTACVHSPAGAPRPAQSPLLTEGDHQITANRHVLAYHVHGKGPYCIVHSGGPGFDWTYDRMPAVEASLTMIYLEPIGTGASAKLASPGDYTLPRYAEELEGFRGALGLEKVWLLGHSHGGFVAQLYAIAHQEHLLGLILYDTAPRLDAEFAASYDAHAKQFFGDKPWFAVARAALDAEDTAKTDDEMTAVFGRELPLYFADFDAHETEYRKAFTGVHVAFAPQHGAPTPFDTRKDLARVKVPTLILVGTRDFVTAVPFSEEMHTAIGGSKLVVLEHSGHMGAMEEPAAFATAVAAFVATR